MIKIIAREEKKGLPLIMELEGLPPSVNEMYRNAGSRRYKRPEVERWQGKLTSEIRRLWGDLPAYTGEVAVYIEFVKSTRRKWDIDNRLKAILDCFEAAGVIENDAQISRIWANRINGDKDSTHIVVEEYQGITKKRVSA